MIVYGVNPVMEALRAGRVKELRVVERGTDTRRLERVVAMADAHGVSVRRVSPQVLDREARGGVHQGVLAVVEEVGKHSIGDLIQSAEGPPLVVVLDGVEDPHNLGAILRTVDAAGADGIVLQSRRSAGMGGAAAKASAGAVAHVRIAEVVNIARALDELKELGVWTIGLAGDADRPYDSVDFTLPTAIVLGAEATGLRRLVRERCDWLVAIPMQGYVDSLNVSVAAGVTLFEAVRQRRKQPSRPPFNRNGRLRSED
jgi:23S rRNA (guanosine2251-2'-O)-methyltransferase